ncbi:MAG: hypothetical protein JST92_09440 [Deltaproteobacteria bacterium]|nr:hypothetical protein [Deltaproteobacteria bacterium]
MIRSRLAQLAPVGWPRLARMLKEVPGCQRWAFGARSQTTGAILSLSFPHWTNELLDNPLPLSRAVELQRTAAHVLSLVQAHEVLIDSEEPPEQAAAHVLPMAALVFERFARDFPSGHPFWPRYRELSEEQALSARWEALARKRPERRLTDSMVYKLGRKGALLRWPGFAVCMLAGRPERAQGVDALLARLLSILQLFDDTSDYAKDALSGQPNAVLAAMGSWPREDTWELHAGAPKAIARVGETVLGLIERVRKDADGKLGPLLEHLQTRAQAMSQTARRRAALQAARRIFGQLSA